MYDRSLVNGIVGDGLVPSRVETAAGADGDKPRPYGAVPRRHTTPAKALHQGFVVHPGCSCPVRGGRLCFASTAQVPELVDGLDLGSSVLVAWGFDSPPGHHDACSARCSDCYALSAVVELRNARTGRGALTRTLHYPQTKGRESKSSR